MRTRTYYFQHERRPGIKTGGAYANGCRLESLAVHPDQIPEYKKILEEAGVRGGVDPDGCPRPVDQEDRNKLMKLENAIDRDAGHGDHCELRHEEPPDMSWMNELMEER